MALASGTARAADYVELNAGQTLSTAESTATGPGGVAIGNIIGTLSMLQDADLFRIYIASPSTFSASAANAGTSGATLDTALFLFDADGHAIATNDDANGFELQAALPTGNFRYASLAAGFYFLGISNSGNEPVNATNNLLFAFGDTTSVRGPAGSINPTTLFDFDSNAYDGNTSGTYRIELTGVTTGPAASGAVPEPATWAMMIAGFGLVGGGMRRRRTQAAFG